MVRFYSSDIIHIRIKGRMKGRPTTGRTRLQMLHMLAKDGYVTMKREAKDKWRWRQRKSCQKHAAWQNTRGREELNQLGYMILYSIVFF